MSARTKDITVHVVCDGETHHLHTYPNEYRSLMQLIYDKIYTEGFGECMGMGKCGTCLVEIIKSSHPLTDYGRNEDTTLKKAAHIADNVRLSCQLMADEFINELQINILPQTIL